MLMNKIHTYLMGVALILAASSCSGVKNSEVVNDNSFTIESADEHWDAGKITFGADGGTITLNIVHDVTSVAWRMRCSLDDTWCSYSQAADQLYIAVSPNPLPVERRTGFDIIIGENISHVTVVQGFDDTPPYESTPSDLPGTTWDDDETNWQ